MNKELPEIGKVYESRDNSGSGFQWQKRCIFVDHFSRNIYIQVLHLVNGELNFLEFQDMNAGNWQRYIPQGLDKMSMEIRNGIRALVSSGYTVRPHFCQGLADDDFNFFMISDIKAPVLTQFQA